MMSKWQCAVQCAVVCATMSAGFAVAAAPEPATSGLEDHLLSAYGLTLYGAVDIGLQYDTHGVPVSDYYVAGTAAFIRPNDQKPVFAATPNNLGQSEIGLSGSEPLAGDWSTTFKLEVYFNPQSGQLSDGLKSLTLNNGRSVGQQRTGLDSSLAGEPLETAYIGFESATFGSLQFGRMLTLLSEGVALYDPQQMSSTFSLFGAQGTATGGGDTEDRRISSLAKYRGEWRAIHFGTDYKFGGAAQTPNSVWQFNLGADFGGGGLDAFYSRVKGAISASSLTATQVDTLPSLGIPTSNALAATVSDNTTLGLMTMYALGPYKLYAGYEFIRYANPDRPLAAGFEDIGGYTLAFINNSAYKIERQLQIFWTGIRYTAGSHLDLGLAYYGYQQNSFASGALAKCATAASADCSGAQTAISGSAVWRFNKRFDSYAGAMYSAVQDGLASSYLHTSLIATTVGLRFRF
jgi:predicted porin